MKIRLFAVLWLSVFIMSDAFAQQSSPATATSAAQVSAYSTAWTNRNLTPFRHQLQILVGPNSVQSLSLGNAWASIQGGSEFGFNVRRHHDAKKTDLPVIGTTTVTNASAHVSMPIGIAFAPINNLEIGLALPFMFGRSDQQFSSAIAPDANNAFGDMPIWATYQVMDGRFQLGVRMAFFLPTQTNFQLQAGLPVLARLGGMRIDSGFFLHVTFDDTQNLTEIFVPFRMGFQITPEWFAGFRTGLNLGFIDGDNFFTLPLYGFAGYTLPTSIGPIDLGLQFGFDQLLRANPIIANRGVGGPANIRYPGDGNFDVSDFSLSIGANLAIQF